MNDRLKFRINEYEGPLDLLLDLISKNKVSIYDIPITLIFNQYMEYISAVQKTDMEIAGEFITMAAELMLIKSRMLLPNVNAENEEDPRAALAAALAEYKLAKEEAVSLGEKFAQYGGRFAKETMELPADNRIDGQDALLLKQAFDRLLNRCIERNELPTATKQSIDGLFTARITPIPEKIIGIIRYLYKKNKASFEEIMLTSKNRSELIASFVAILELVRSQRIILEENGENLFLTLKKSKNTVKKEKKK